MRVPILCYHKVGPISEEGRSLNIEARRLEAHVRYFRRKRYEFLGASELEHWPERPSVCFTFDDAYASTVENAVPLFERYGAKLTLYAVSECVGVSSRWDGDSARPLANWDQLRLCQSAGHEVGNHTARHPHMSRLSIVEQEAEIKECHRALSDQGIEAKSFCYPYGSLNGQSEDVVRGAGYRVGMALEKRIAGPEDSRWSLPRIVLAYSDGLPMLFYKLKVKPWLRRSGGPS